jgi:hypothetical protein
MNGNDCTSMVDIRSISWNTAKTGEPDSLNFSAMNLSENPVEGQEVVLSQDEKVLFRGSVVRVNHVPQSVDLHRITIECVDASYEAQKGTLIAEIYTDTSAENIIIDLVSRYPQLSGFTTENASCSEVVPYLFLDHLKFPEVLQRLAEVVGYEWYIDSDRDIHFFLAGAESAPQEINADNGTMQKESLSMSEKGDDIVNMIIVRGSEKNASTKTAEAAIIANGTDTEFPMNGLYSGVEVTVAGAAKTVGAYGLHDATAFDCLYDYDAKKIIFRDDNRPTVGQSVVIAGFSKIPIIVQAVDSSSVDIHGVRAERVRDENLKTEESALQYALSILRKKSQKNISARFSTRISGFRAGQEISISHSLAGIDERFYVQRTTTRFFSPEISETSVEVAKAQQIDAIGILARLLSLQKSTSSASEILDIFFSPMEHVRLIESYSVNVEDLEYSDSVSVSESSAVKTNEAIEFVLGPYSPTSLDDPKQEFVIGSSLLS